MHEFMLLVRNEIGYQSDWPEHQRLEFLSRCQTYIDELTREGRLKAAQPLVMEGTVVAGPKGIWHELPFGAKREVVVGYYHVLAKDMEDAVALARRNPEFSYGTTARVEVRPLRLKEEATGFTYPGPKNAA